MIHTKTNIKRAFAAAILLLCLLCSGCSGIGEKTYSDTAYPLERNGVQLHLDCMSSDSAAIRDNILLVHGLTYSSHEFDVDYEDYSLVHFLCDEGYAVWRLDIAGCGQSGSVDDGFAVDSQYASEDVEAAIYEILDITQADTIDLLGWSWGTVTGTLAEARCSELIDRFVLYAPIMTGLGYEEIAGAFHENSWEHAASDFQMNEDGSLNEEVTDPIVADIYCSNCWRYDGASSPNGGRRDLCVDGGEVLIDVSTIRDPTLVICGDADPYLNMPVIEASAALLPEGSELVVIEGASHCAMVEKPFYHEFRQELIGFLRGEKAG